MLRLGIQLACASFRSRVYNLCVDQSVLQDLSEAPCILASINKISIFIKTEAWGQEHIREMIYTASGGAVNHTS